MKSRFVKALNKWIIFIISLYFTGISFAQSNFNQQIYNAYIQSDMAAWEKILGQMESEYRQKPNTSRLLDICIAQYGLIGYLIADKQKDKASRFISVAEENLGLLEKQLPAKTNVYALKAAVMAYKINISPYKAPYLGPKSFAAVEKALEIDNTSPYAWVEHGNSYFYRPALFGGSKETAITSYLKAIRLFEESGTNRDNWIYLNTLMIIARYYADTGKTEKADATYKKILKFEPGFKYVKEELYPEFKKNFSTP
ncbi:MAG: hypothetical protein JXJ22_10320 [Bacteroidales bacterium]|nr:hypothetical protein [Bacteroidales bacterium]